MATLNFKILPARRKSDGKLGIYLALTHRKQVRYISTEFEIDDVYQFHPEKWIVYHRSANVMNKRMRYVLKEYQAKLDELPLHRFATCTELKEALTSDKKVSEYITLSELFDAKIKRLHEANRHSYAVMNATTRNTCVSILGDIPIRYITRDTIKMLHRTMLQQGHAPGNVQMRMSHLKAAINEAIDDKLVIYEEHPFHKYTMPRPEPAMMDITIEQFRKILYLKTTRQQLILARNMFLLSFYLGGINLADLVKVDLRGPMLDYIRQKSGDHKTGNRHTVINIPEEAVHLINIYINADGHIEIPYKSINFRYQQRYVNKCLEALANHVGITTRFSYYSARKTFTQFAFMLGIRTEVIEYCVGQTMKTNRPIYNYVRVMQHQADAAIAKVIDYTRHPDRYEALMPQYYTDYTTTAV